ETERGGMGPIDAMLRSRFRIAVAIVALSACGQTPREASRPTIAATPAKPETGHIAELEKPPTKALDIDWSAVTLSNETDALTLWQRIAPTGVDYEEKLDEVPEGEITTKLAEAMLRGGNFTCVLPQPPRDCVTPPIDVPEPAPSATLVDPCLRRVLAIWAISQLDDHSGVRDALR